MKVFYTTIFLFLSSILCGQDFKLSNTVVDSKNNKKLQYANIMVMNYNIGTSSDCEGKFEFILPDSLSKESIKVTYVGYEPLILSISTAMTVKEISLIPKNIFLEEIVVKPAKKKSKLLVVNKFNKKECIVRYSQMVKNPDVWIPKRPAEPTIEAIFFPYKKEYENMRIKEISLRVTNYKKAPTSFNLRLYEADENGIPSNSLLANNLIIESTKERETITINLEKNQIMIPQNGVFVGFELLIIDSNKSEGFDNKGNKFILYSPYLNFTRKKKEEYFWLYTKGEWRRTKQEITDFLDKNLMLYLMPAISMSIME